MRFFYTLLIYLLAPLFILRLFWKSRLNPAYRARWQERFGYFSDQRLRKTIWIHAVSVGEAQATQHLVSQLQERFPGYHLVMSTTTPTGAERVESLYGDSLSHYYFPYDLPGVLNRWIQHIDPQLLIMMETEVWPNLLFHCKKHNIPTVLANARLSEKSCKGYEKLGRFTAQVFGLIDLVAAQGESDAMRFKKMGVDPHLVEITGSVKFDIHQKAFVREQAEAIRRLLGIGRPVWVAASTREGEEEAVLAAHQQILKTLPEALLVLVPRHPERFDKVAQLCEQQGLGVVRRSENRACDATHKVFLGDSMGELALMYQLADVAFVGGSLVDTGGQNILEPACLGLPVLFGPSMYNFADISEMLLQQQAACRVDDANMLAETTITLLRDASLRATLGENGRRVIAQNQGASKRLVEFIFSRIRLQ